ncbi:hypothetical protein ALC56_14850 [Trachymyrmex septentrionalis]|uniref:Uncharacterized protein n=1 Tax=Trachymyrmex septentrionalis TaxID=34720 RepID=A0A195ES33_9HYME|nr:hypothetical protein ALC56_14850 [Trachymyrmex septentrionalis]
MLRKVGLVGRWVGRSVEKAAANGVKHVYSRRVSSIGGVARSQLKSSDELAYFPIGKIRVPLLSTRNDATKGQLDIAIDTHRSLNNSLSIDARKIVSHKASGNQCAMEIRPF